MEFEIDISKKYLFILLGAILILLGAIYVNAQSSSIIWHNVEELENVQKAIINNCEANEGIQMVNEDGSVDCVSLSSGPEGPVGDPGSSPQGAQGPRGPTGYTGSQGPAGQAANPAICTKNGKQYSEGAKCYTGSCSGGTTYTCKSNGDWYTSSAVWPCGVWCS